MPATTPTDTTTTTTVLIVVDFGACTSAYDAERQAAGEDGEAQCDAVQVLSDCLLQTMTDAGVESIEDPNVANATQIVETALSNTTNSCEAFTLVDMMTLSAIDGDQIVVHDFESPDAYLYRYSRSTFRLQDLTERLAGMAAAAAQLRVLLQSRVNTAKAAVDTEASTVAASLADTVLASSSTMTGAVSTARSAAQSVQYDAKYAVPLTVANAYNQAVNTLAQEAAALDTVRGGFADQLQFKAYTLASGHAQDAADRYRITSDDSVYTSSLASQVGGAVSDFAAGEAARVAGETQSVTDAVADVQAYVSTGMPVAITSEVSRATVAQASFAASISFAMTTASGSTDFAACLSTQEGTFYMSQAQSAMFFCDGTYWNQIMTFTPNFAGSRIVDTTLAYLLEGPQLSINYHRWTLCFSGNVHGWSSYTFHNNCNYKGKTLMIAKYGTRVYGAFQDDNWSSRNGWGYSYYGCFLWRLNLGSIETARNYQQYSFYDYYYYGPTFGGGHDLYVDSNARYFSMGASSYTAPGYNSNWLAGTSSGNNDEMEIWYRNG